jgi:hypothetical protein
MAPGPACVPVPVAILNGSRRIVYHICPGHICSQLVQRGGVVLSSVCRRRTCLGEEDTGQVRSSTLRGCNVGFLACNKKKKQIGDHALPQRGFGLGTPEGAER